MADIKARMIYDVGSDTRNLFIRVKRQDGSYFIKFQFEKIEPYVPHYNPSIGFDDVASSEEIVQAILNEAWEQGMRPIGFTDIKNEVSALKDHLSDLRKIAFTTLKVK